MRLHVQFCDLSPRLRVYLNLQPVWGYASSKFVLIFLLLVLFVLVLSCFFLQQFLKLLYLVRALINCFEIQSSIKPYVLQCNYTSSFLAIELQSYNQFSKFTSAILCHAYMLNDMAKLTEIWFVARLNTGEVPLGCKKRVYLETIAIKTVIFFACWKIKRVSYC